MNATNQTKLAEAVGKTTRTIRNYVARDDWPFGRRGPYPVEKVKGWIRRTIQSEGRASDTADSEDSDEKRRVEIELKREQIKKIRFERMRVEGQYIPRDVFNRGLVGLIQMVRQRLEEWISGLPAILNPGDPEVARQGLLDAYDRLCADMAAQTDLELAEEADVTAYRSHPSKKKAGGLGKRRRKK